MFIKTKNIKGLGSLVRKLACKYAKLNSHDWANLNLLSRARCVMHVLFFSLLASVLFFPALGISCMFPVLCTVACFPALGISCMFPVLCTVACFPALGISCMFPAPCTVACFPALGISCMFTPLCTVSCFTALVTVA